MRLGWIQTVVATKPVDKSNTWIPWRCIYDSADDPGFGKKSCVQLWVCEQDLKEEFENSARETFGDALQQIVRMGDSPSIEYTSGKKNTDDDTRWKWPPLYGPID